MHNTYSADGKKVFLQTIVKYFTGKKKKKKCLADFDTE
jgi:hypothetical protein